MNNNWLLAMMRSSEKKNRVRCGFVVMRRVRLAVVGYEKWDADEHKGAAGGFCLVVFVRMLVHPNCDLCAFVGRNSGGGGGIGR